MGSAVSPVIANIYIEYFEELALGPQCPITTQWWKRYVDYVICITKEDQVDILFNHINNIDDHIKFTMECPDNEGSNPFLDSNCNPNLNHTLHTMCIENLHIQTDVWTGIPTTQYLLKGQSSKHSAIGPRWYAPPQIC